MHNLGVSEADFDEARPNLVYVRCPKSLSYRTRCKAVEKIDLYNIGIRGTRVAITLSLLADIHIGNNYKNDDLGSE